MSIRIRRPEEPDVEKVCALNALCSPNYRESPEMWAAASREQGRSDYWVAEAGPFEGGEPTRNAGSDLDHGVIGYCRVHREGSATTRGGTFRLFIGVHPNHRRRGVGSALYAQIERELLERQVERIRVRARSTQAEAIRFFLNRGFLEYDRKLTLALALAQTGAAGSADNARVCPDTPAPTALDPHSVTLDRSSGHNVSICSLSHYSSQDPDWLSKLLPVYNRLGHDVPQADPYRPLSPDELDRFLARPDLSRDGFWVAMAGSQIVGFSYLLGKRGEEEVVVGMTGVLPEYRRQGIATALKLQGIRYAKSAGFRKMLTGASSTNAASIAVNERLGFKRVSEEVRLERSLGQAAR